MATDLWYKPCNVQEKASFLADCLKKNKIPVYFSKSDKDIGEC